LTTEIEIYLKTDIHILAGIALRCGFHDWIITAVGATGAEEEMLCRVSCSRGRPPAGKVGGLPHSLVISSRELFD